MPFFPVSVGLAGDANVLAISHFRLFSDASHTQRSLNQQFKNLKEERLKAMLSLISKPQLLCITKSEPGV